MAKRYSDFLNFLKAHGDKDECLLWPYQTNRGGYGIVHVPGDKLMNNGYQTGVHRKALELTLGRKLNDGFECCHLCTNRNCFAPSHLYEGTRGENVRDRTRDGTDNRGERCATHKLIESQVIEIRALWASGKHTQRALAKMYGVGADQISRIVNRQRWGWLP